VGNEDLLQARIPSRLRWAPEQAKQPHDMDGRRDQGVLAAIKREDMLIYCLPDVSPLLYRHRRSQPQIPTFPDISNCRKYKT